ncbi:MAG: c-type cytochrome [Sphingomonadaceae bacterium]
MALAIPFATSETQASVRSGEQVVESVCAACHATGANGAPRIGDENAWKARAAQGLTSLTRHAIEGIRRMPPHGGNPSVSDFEIELAITYMVNHSGGHWTMPIDKSAPAVERSGEEVVRTQCVKCHGSGVDGAPKVGDRAAWIPRMEFGINALVRSAINGHGGMPPRGGMAQLSATEIRSAIVYMLNQGLASASAGLAGAATPATRSAGNRKVVAGIEIYLGVVSAQALRGQHRGRVDAESTMHGGIPRGEEYFHLNVSLYDSASGAPITDATVAATVSDPIMGGETKSLELMAIGDGISYGDYFQVAGPNPHTVTLRIYRPSAPAPVTAKFDFSP